jgi:3-hydroxyisobutyrate dehydrogenase-like beta-hydroxyacid dehydrogenase
MMIKHVFHLLTPLNNTQKGLKIRGETPHEVAETADVIFTMVSNTTAITSRAQSGGSGRTL